MRIIYNVHCTMLLICWQAYRGDHRHRKTALHYPEVKSKQIKKITCRAYSTFKIG